MGDYFGLESLPKTFSRISIFRAVVLGVILRAMDLV
jgi:hypothetical protein